MKLLFLINLLLLIPLTSPAKSLSLKEFIKLSIEKDEEFQSLEIDKEKAKYLVDQSLDSSALRIELGAERGYVDSGDSTNSSNTIGLSKNFASTGTSLTFSNTESVQPNIDSKQSEIKIEQSLWKNAFGKDRRLLERNLNSEAELLTQQTEEALEEYLRDCIVSFFEYQLSHSRYLLAKENFEDSKKLFIQVKQKFSKRIATKTDLEKSELEMLSTEQELLLRQQEWKALGVSLARIVGSNEFSLTKDQLEDIYKKLSQLQVKEKSIELIRDVLIARKRYELAKGEALYLQNQEKSELNLVLGSSKEKSVRYSSSVDQRENFVGLEYTLLLDNRQAKANATVAKMEESKQMLKERMDRKSTEDSIKELKLQLQYRARVKDLLEKKNLLARSVYQKEKQRYSYGKIDLDSLLERKKTYIASQKDYQENLLNYLGLSISWLELNDELISFVAKL